MPYPYRAIGSPFQLGQQLHQVALTLSAQVATGMFKGAGETAEGELRDLSLWLSGASDAALDVMSRPRSEQGR